MSKLDDGNDGLIFEERVTVSPVGDFEFKDSESIRCLQISMISRLRLVLLSQENSVVRIKFGEFKLNVVSNEWDNGSIWKLLNNVNIEFELIKNSVVLRVHSSPSLALFVVSKVRELKDSSLLEGPLS